MHCLASWVELIVDSDELGLRGRKNELRIQLAHPQFTLDLAKSLGAGLEIEDALQSVPLSENEKVAIRSALVANGLTDESYTSVNPPDAIELDGLTVDGSVVLVGLGVLGCSLMRALDTSELFVCDHWPVHRGDIGPLFLESQIGQSRCEAAMNNGHFGKRVVVADSKAMLARYLRDASLTLVCIERVDLALLSEIGCLASGEVAVLEATHNGIDLFIQPRGADSCLNCLALHRSDHDSYAASTRAKSCGWRPDWRLPLSARQLREAVACLRSRLWSGSGLMSVIKAGQTSRVQPHPQCVRCFKAFRMPSPHAARETYTKTSLSDLHPILRELLDADHGLLRTARASPMQLSQTSVWANRGIPSDDCAVANLFFGTCLSATIGANSSASVRGEGARASNADATAVAMLEALERIFTVHHPPPAELKATAWREISERAISPQALSLFSTTQLRQPGFEFHPFDEDVRLDWVWATRLNDETAWLIPRDFIGHTRRLVRIAPASSNGAAAHSSFIDATVNGLLEIIERDSLLYCWLTRHSPPLVLDTDELIARVPLARSLVHLGFRLTLLDGDAGLGVPVLLAVIEDNHNPAVFMMNAASGVSPEEALDKLCREFVMVMRGYLESAKMSVSNSQRKSDISLIRSPHQHFDFYQTSARLPATSFLTCSREHRLVSDLNWQEALDSKKYLQTLVGQLSARGIEVFVVNCTPARLRDLGVEVVKVLAPGTIPMYFGERYRPLATARLGDRGGKSLNPWPHPYC